MRHLQVLDTQEYEMLPLMGHPVGDQTHGMGPIARWLALGELALVDLQRSLTPSAAPGARSKWALALVLPVLDDARFFYASACRADQAVTAFTRMLTAGSGLPLDPTRHRAFTIGPAGVGLAIDQARIWLEDREVDHVLVLAVDSLLDAYSLAWLAAGRRLKEPENPVGLAPGEAAVAILLARRDPADSRAVDPMVTTVVVEDVDCPFISPERPNGRAMAAAIRRAGAATGVPLSGDVYLDLNGEIWRAAEFGSAQASVPGGLSQPCLRLPATSVGDTGAASGALAIACAAHANARNYSSGPRSWVLSSSDYGEVSVVCVAAPFNHG